MSKPFAWLFAAACVLCPAWAAAVPDPGLTAQEKTWLSAHPEIRLGTVPKWEPISMRDDRGQLSGMAGDYKRLLEQRLGMHFVLQQDMPWNEVLGRVKKRDMDVVMLLGKTPDRDGYLNFTEVLVDLPYVIITRADAQDVADVKDLAGKRIALRDSFVVHEWLSREYPELQLVPKEETHDALNAVALGEADAFVGDLASASYAIEKLGLVRLKVAGHAAFTNRLRIGVRKDWPELASILEKGGASIAPDERKDIWSKWVRLQQSGIDPRIVYVLASVLALLIVGLLAWSNRRLRHSYDIMEDKVRERTAELAKAGEFSMQEMQRYETLLRTAGDGIHVIDVNGDVVQVNDAFCRMLGYTRDEMRGMNVVQWDAQWSPEELKERIRELEGRSMTFETRHRRHDGNIIDVEVNVVGVEIGGQQMVYCASRDITQRKRAERDLAESEARLNELFENMSSGVAVYRVGADGQFVFSGFNRAAERIEKLRREDVIGRKLVEVFPGVNELGFLDVLHRVWESGVPEQFPVSFYHDGRISGWRDNYVYKLPSGEVVAIYDDVTERKQAAEELERLNRDFISLLENTSDFIYFKDQDSRIRFCSRSMALIVGHQDWRELIGKHDLEIFPEETAKIYYEEELPVFREGKPLLNKVDPYLDAQGARCWVNTNKWPVFGADGKTVVGIFGISRDITEQVRAAEALRKSEELFREMTETSPLAIYMSEGIEQRAHYINPAFVRLFGYTMEDVPTAAEWWPRAYPDEDYRRQISEEWQRRAAHAIETKSAIEPMEVFVTCKDGSQKYISWGFTSVGDQNWAFGQDLTERKAAEDALLRSNADLEQFAYSISHDLRAPLRAVSGHLQLLERALKGRLEEDDRQNMAFALDGAKRMDAMILSLLEYSRVGRKTESMQWMASRDSLDEALGFLAPEIDKAAASVSFEGEWPRVYASRDELTRLFQNLIGNAVHYHDEGKAPQVEVASSVSGNVWRVSVRDHGIGIEPKQIDRLFHFFSRLQPRSRFDGTGMGLALCRKIVEHHHGHIWAESEGEGKGSAFVFVMPVGPEAAGDKGESA